MQEGEARIGRAAIPQEPAAASALGREGCFLATFGRRMVYSPAFRPERLIVSGRRSRSVVSKMDSFSYAPVHGSPGC